MNNRVLQILCDICADETTFTGVLEARRVQHPPGIHCEICGTTAMPPTAIFVEIIRGRFYSARSPSNSPPRRQPPRTPSNSPPRRQSPPGTPPLLQGVGLGGGFSPISHAPAGETRRNTFVLDEDCPICLEQDKAGHRMCLRCNSGSCNDCWFKVDKCGVCRYNKN